MKQPVPKDEAARLEALRAYAILDTPPEQALDDITFLAAHLCKAPTALITFVDADRQWFKSRVGWTQPQTSRDVSFCAHAIVASDGGELVVPDAVQDPRFSNNPYVTGPPGIRFYAGVPLVNPEGHALGALCVIDHVPRTLEPAQLAALRALRRAVVSELEVRRSRAQLDLAASSLDRYRQLAEASPDAILVHSGERIVFANQAMALLLGVPAPESLIGLPSTFMVDEAHRATALQRTRALYRGEVLARSEQVYVRADGSLVHVEVAATPFQFEGKAAAYVTARDVNERHEADRRVKAAQNMARLGYVTSRPDGSFESSSENLPGLLGLDPAAIPASIREFLAFVHPNDREAFREAAIGSARAGEPATMEYRMLRRDGGWLYVRQISEPLRAPQGARDGATWLATIQDVTEQKLAEGRIRRLTRVHAMLSGINAAIVRIRDRALLLREACRIAVEAGNLPMAWIGLVDDRSAKIDVSAAEGAVGDFFEAASRELELGEAASLTARAIVSGQPLVANDLVAQPPALMSGPCAERGLRSFAAIPLVLDGKALGVFALFAGERGFFDEEEMRLLAELAGDVSFALEVMARREQLEFVSRHDPLTGLPNRRLFEERLQQLIAQARADSGRLAVAIMDVERFRAINSALGRHAGDLLLTELTRRFLAAGLDPERMARVGADQFALVVPGPGSDEALVRDLDDMRQRVLSTPFAFAGHEVHASFRAGLAIFPVDGNDAELLMRHAEVALRRAKARGDRFLLFTEEMSGPVAEKLALESRLRQALGRGEFVLHYQPKVKASTRKVVGVEALLRWRSPHEGLLMPAAFLPILEETALIIEVGAWALDRAAGDQLGLRSRGIAPMPVAVNVSSLQLRQADFAARVEAAVGRGAAIDLEITESVLMHELEENAAKLHAIRGMGVGIAIDDFGTGYSSLAYLAKLPVAALKIDRTFVDAMLSDASAMVIVRTVISLGHSMGLRVIAEGVETEPQADRLDKLGCDELQGYLFGKPLPLEELAASWI